MKPPIILIFGASGKIGGVVSPLLSETYDVTPLAHQPPSPPLSLRWCDITSEKSVAATIAAIRPDWVVNLAAMADPATCHRNPDQARKVNIDGARNVARLSADWGARVIHYSTDLVFDGERGNYTEKDPPNPKTLYAETKCESERVTLQAHPENIVLRTAITYGPKNGQRRDFFATTLQRLREGKEVNIFTDQFRSFLFVNDSARALSALIRSECTGIYHLAGPERMSRYAFTLAALKKLGEPAGTVRPIARADSDSPTFHCADCSLHGGKIKKEAGFSPLSLDEAMESYKKSLRQQGEN